MIMTKTRPLQSSMNTMTFFFKFRDFYCSPIKILEQINIQPGSYVLDYGCGSGSYSIPAAHLVGNNKKNGHRFSRIL
jgi:ubiquinone/menaquinone biosynthesis C-methylase UbiE